MGGNNEGARDRDVPIVLPPLPLPSPLDRTDTAAATDEPGAEHWRQMEPIDRQGIAGPDEQYACKRASPVCLGGREIRRGRSGWLLGRPVRADERARRAYRL